MQLIYSNVDVYPTCMPSKFKSVTPRRRRARGVSHCLRIL